MACSNCHAAYPADRDNFGAAAEREAVPFFDRRGWTIGGGALASLVGVGFVAAAADSRENERYVGEPRVGDIYEVDMARMIEKPEQAHMYTALRVVSVRKDEIEFQMANMYYDRIEGVRDDVRAGKTSQLAYYMEGSAAMKKTELKRMYDDGALEDVER